MCVPSLSISVIASMFLSWALSSSCQDAINQCSQRYSLHIPCLSCSSSVFSRDGPFFVSSAQLIHRSKGFAQFCTRLNQRNQFRRRQRADGPTFRGIAALMAENSLGASGSTDQARRVGGSRRKSPLQCPWCRMGCASRPCFSNVYHDSREEYIKSAVHYPREMCDCT